MERAIGRWIVGSSLRCASGRPLTPIIGGNSNGQGGFTPVYGDPFSERLPALVRWDLSASRYRRINDHTSLVMFAALTNVLNHGNTYNFEYSEDFSVRKTTPSTAKRTLYAGFSLMFN